MLEDTKIWTKGKMNLFVNHEPKEVYVTRENVLNAYKDLQSTLTNDGSVPIGIDHLPEAVIKASPVLEKLDLLNVGTITAVGFNATDDSIEIKEATLTNPLIKDLYLKGELDSVSIVAPATVKTCPQNDDVLIVEKTTINRVDIVGEGACPTCKIPKPTNTEDFVYARKPINTNTEVNDMAEDETITMENIQALLDEALNPVTEKLTAIEERVAALEEKPADDEGKPGEEKDDEIKAAKAEAAEALVDAQIMAGKVVPAQKEAMTKLALADTESFKALMKDAPIIVDLEARRSLLTGDNGEGDEDETLTPEEENLNAVLDHFAGE
ncbi:phage protease [uncultured Methanobrevibacter sp.]|uniref:phage protease n=1 Tax=uncultured Methanobrevibacter sp. TaxID=253161 RepID=UPI0025E7F270|nr:phage protease [uncultured Methanobrevibacter sp.]